MANTTVYYEEPYGSNEANRSAKETTKEPVLFWPSVFVFMIGCYLVGLEGSLFGGMLALGGGLASLLSVRIAEK